MTATDTDRADCEPMVTRHVGSTHYFKCLVFTLIAVFGMSRADAAPYDPMMQLGGNLIQNDVLAPNGSRGVPGKWTLKGAVKQVRHVPDANDHNRTRSRMAIRKRVRL